ncbi:MAG: tRNA1(Val) (adenine(37)-N6)-methyltransferase [Tissierellaceae bacterium]|jgi:tRNA1Val (adenine37-N6)-methyltransferase|nr:tRNA1(Val) (adenine(37)-N6)-methyltransferase [Tissierellia bacterium]
MEGDVRIDIVPGSQYRILQNKRKFSYGIDAIILSDFAQARGLVMDLGTGTGIIPIRLADGKDIKKIYGVEIQGDVAELAKESVKLNKLEEKIQILNMDLKDLRDRFSKASFDTIISNPPYMKTGSAILNEEENFALSRHEIACSFEDIISVSDYLLKPLGKIYLVHRPNRLVDILSTMRQYRIEPKYIRFVQPRWDKKPNLVLIEGVKGGRADLKFHDPLIVYDENGNYLDEIYEIYGMDR